MLHSDPNACQLTVRSLLGGGELPSGWLFFQRPDNGLKSRRILRLRPRLARRHLRRAPIESGLRTGLWRHLGFRLVFSPLSGHCKKYAPHDRDLARREGEARAAKRGLWSQPGAIPRWDWRKSE